MSTRDGAKNELEDQTLSQYFDGELSEDEASEVRAILDRQDDVGTLAKQKLGGLERLHELMQLAAEEVATDLDAKALFARVSDGLDKDAAEGGHGLSSIDGGRKHSAGRLAQTEPWKVNIPIVIGLAAAAAILTIVWQAGNDGDFARTNHRGVGHDDEREVLVQIEDDQAPVHVEAPQGSKVEAVDFGDNTGTVFAVEGTAGEPIAVVWIDDEPDEAMR